MRFSSNTQEGKYILCAIFITLARKILLLVAERIMAVGIAMDRECAAIAMEMFG